MSGRKSLRRKSPCCHGAHCGPRLALVILFVAGTAAAQAPPARSTGPTAAVVVDGTPHTLAETIQVDAALADVTFVDRLTGWAVGERGVIWHTTDGGATWQFQPSGVTCRLHSIAFLDARRGWAAGGTAQPYSHTSRGVLVATDDGGATWRQLPTPLLPALTHIEFFDDQRGVATGGGSSFAPSGVFVTTDGGENWLPLPCDHRGQWLAADFVDLETGAVAGEGGDFATLMRRNVVRSPAAVISLRSFHALKLQPPTGGWLVGDGGIVMRTDDLGRNWQSTPGALPRSMAEQFDLYAVDAIGPHVWTAGAPGTRIFHSPDGGQTWQSAPTGRTTPLRAINFVDADTGWAIGDLGAILATCDGGRSWQLQRQGGSRAAVLAAFAQPADVPLELLAKCGGEDGYLAVVDVIRAADRSIANARIDEAMQLAGATATSSPWQLELPPGHQSLSPEILLAKLNRENDGQALQRLLQYYVRQLRTWRPEVVLTYCSDETPSNPAAMLVEQLIAQAAQAAADPTQFPELAMESGLTTWKVKRIYGVLPAGSRGDGRLTTGQFAPRLAATLADWTEPSRQRLFSTHAPPPDLIELRCIQDDTGQSLPGGGDIFSGIALAPGSDGRRRLANLPANADELRRLAARRRQMLALVNNTSGNAAWSAQSANLVEGLDADSAGTLLFQLADGYRSTGKLDLAADTFAELARRAPEHPLAVPALAWLIRFYASSEAAHRLAAERAPNVRTLAGEDAESSDSRVRQASATLDVAPVVSLSRDDRLRRAGMLGQYAEAAQPALYAEPSIRFPLVVAQRQLGFANPAKRYLLALRALPENDPWRECAQTEEWLAEAAEQPPSKPLANCRRTTDRPHLDGRLDESMWQSAERMDLTNRERESSSAGLSRDTASSLDEKDSRPRSASVRLSYDHEFLYVAASCPKAGGVEYSADDRPRTRDADLTPQDRVELRLDLDRDYTTAFEFTIDRRGWTHEACWGDATWNPTWYVAADGDDASWTIEAAIPLAELTDRPPEARHVWAIAIRRIVPGVGDETWAGEGTDSPSPYGLLIFE